MRDDSVPRIYPKDPRFCDSSKTFTNAGKQYTSSLLSLVTVIEIQKFSTYQSGRRISKGRLSTNLTEYITELNKC